MARQVDAWRNDYDNLGINCKIIPNLEPRFEAKLENFNEPQFRCANKGSENDDERFLNLKSMVLPPSEVWQFGLAKLGIF